VLLCVSHYSTVTMMAMDVTDATFYQRPDVDLDLDLHLRPDPDNRSVSVVRTKRSASELTSSMTSQQTAAPPRGLSNKLKVNIRRMQ